MSGWGRALTRSAGLAAFMIAAGALAARFFPIVNHVVLGLAVLAGYDAGEKGRSPIHELGFAVVLTIAIFIVLDYEYPRAGLFIHLDATDQLLVDLQQDMNHH